MLFNLLIGDSSEDLFLVAVFPKETVKELYSTPFGWKGFVLYSEWCLL